MSVPTGSYLHHSPPIDPSSSTYIYTLSLHDALPISTTTITLTQQPAPPGTGTIAGTVTDSSGAAISGARLEGQTSELQSQFNGVCCLPLITKGSATVTASMAGFQTATKNDTVTAGA